MLLFGQNNFYKHPLKGYIYYYSIRYIKQHTLHELILFTERATITSESHVFLLKTRKRKIARLLL